jgi:hypothetical protein
MHLEEAVEEMTEKVVLEGESHTATEECPYSIPEVVTSIAQ